MEGQRSSNQQRVHQLLTQAGHAFIARAQVVQQGPQQAPPFVQQTSRRLPKVLVSPPERAGCRFEV